MADVIRKVRSKYNHNSTADVLAEHGDRLWVIKEEFDFAYTTDAESWEDIPPVPSPKIGEYWGYGEGDHGLKWLVVNVNEAEGHWSMIETSNNYGFTTPLEFGPDPDRTEVARSDFRGYTRRLPEERMVRKNVQPSDYFYANDSDRDPFAD